MSDDIREAFLIEFDEFVTSINQELKNAKNNKPTNNYEVFRAFHTWKGNAVLLGYSDFGSFASKHTEHFRSKKDEHSLTEDIVLLENILSELEKFRKTF
jgi:chemotaxis protein histidine kinase CheA